MDGISAYRDNNVTTQPRGRLIVLLYEGAIKFLRQAIGAIEAKDYEKKAKYLGRALDIIYELDYSLDVEAGGEVVANLRRLYDFMRRHLTEANLSLDTEQIRQVISLLEDLNEGWRAIAD